ncbi:KUP/HAK/KT family potassium transporter [Periweissella fabaria]|uniref:Probable potassium transport system protein Kup n=1 Tax=Periweissella fabaria TaxID=546157 RepID=A0ABM8Z5K3_9LACO|nr:KUP/HAK/KT family potassium transporter [Periweissella fabaria]MCM0597397.1 KUP/HAK/KT family potassium transporter [Periweissella fabaria]CAH0416097.1 Low affinity potassium transport system protein kup [Periweissella fabaria]
MERKKELVSLGTALVAIGIVYGDIGTSPLYTMNAILAHQGIFSNLTKDYIFGAISLVFWTITLVTTIKYVLIALRADNRGEGGIFALYAIVRNRAKWLIVPAVIGGAALLADGTLTPAMTVTSAIEGLKGQTIGSFVFSNNQNIVVAAVVVILLALFMLQRYGTNAIGKLFGPIMFIWFAFLGLMGIMNMFSYPDIWQALLPQYGVKLLFSPENKVGIFILGSVFLATTGSEALYSDMGHVGKRNIYFTWPFVFITLVLNYMGQGAWTLTHMKADAYQNLSGINPFFAMMPDAWRIFGIIIATLAAIIASQALITGSFTLVNEAIGLKILPRIRMRYPNFLKSQVYIRFVNWLMCAASLGIVLLFRTSEHMEAAYGLAITVTMLMTTLLLYEFISMRRNRASALVVALFFGALETLFLLASLIKFIDGGYVTVLITLAIVGVMILWYFGNKARDKYVDESEYVSLRDFRKQLVKLSNDTTVPEYAANLVYIANVKQNYTIKRSVLYSILDKQPKRAKVYWFVSIHETTEPFERRYTVDMMGTRNIVCVHLYLGFKVSQTLSLYLREIVNQLIAEEAIDLQIQKYSTIKGRKIGNFSYVVMKQKLADLRSLQSSSFIDRTLIAGRLFLQEKMAAPAIWYGLEFSEVLEEPEPLFINRKISRNLHKDYIKNTVPATKTADNKIDD